MVTNGFKWFLQLLFLRSNIHREPFFGPCYKLQFKEAGILFLTFSTSKQKQGLAEKGEEERNNED